MKHVVIDDILKIKNILIENEVMPNGEDRTRVKYKDFSSVNLTTSKDDTKWQNTHHNAYRCKDTMTYVIKFGDTKEKDWNPADRLDEISKKCNVEKLI